MNGTLVFRAERKSLQFKTTTSQEVGPGAYDPNLPVSPSGTIAPFLNSETRALNVNNTTSAITPGPGTYGRGHDSVVNQTVGGGRNVSPHSHASSFVSTSTRFHVDKSTPMQSPGPGTYADNKSWVKDNKRYKSTSPSKRAVVSNTPNPPSIPAYHQSYGYDEGPQGELTMQPPPLQPHTGEGYDRVGPGEYEPPPDVQIPNKAPGWARSKAKRADFTKAKETPGPGAYNTVLPVKTQENVININGYVYGYGAGTSSFASKAPLAHQREPQEFEILPGPGAYTPLPVGPTSTRLAPPPKELQTFGTRSARDYEVDPTRQHHAPTQFKTPGPGQYDETRRSVNPKKTFNVEPNGFISMAQRFGTDETATPGPGAYQPDAVVSLAKEIDNKVVSKSGVFGTVAPRFKHTATSLPPGPGNYNPTSVSKPTGKKSSPAFASKADRFRPETAPPAALDLTEYDGNGPIKGDPSRLGPGAYTLPSNWNQRNQKGNYLGYRKPGFGSESNRFKHKAEGGPGPAVYNNAVDIKQVYRPITVPNPKGAFGVQMDRFKNTKTYTPGPGYYEAENGLNKKSFNITVDGVVS